MQLLLQDVLQFKGNVSILCRIIIHLLGVKLVHRTLLFARTNERVDVDGLVLQIHLSEVIHVVTQLRCKDVMCNHRVEHLAFEMDAVVRQHHHVVFDVLSNLQDFVRLVHSLELVYNF